MDLGMLNSAQVDLFKATLGEAAVDDALFNLACRLRDSGSAQVELYLLFSHFQQRLSPEDLRYDAVADTMDLIWGGPRAKGYELFPKELTEAAIPKHRCVAPPPWVDVDAAGRAALEHELALEIGPDHVLANRAGRALFRRGDCDDALFAVRNSPEVALVHLTWSSSREPHGFPSTTLFASLLDWWDDVESPTSE
jgi:hypothetical protein